MSTRRTALLLILALTLGATSLSVSAQSAYRLKFVDIGFNAAVFELNNKGELVGTFFPDAGGTRAFIWRDGQMQFLPNPAGAIPNTTFGVSINDNSEVTGVALVLAGSADPDTRVFKMFIWTQGHYLPLIAPPVGELSVNPNRINNRRQVLAVANNLTDPTNRLYIWEAGRFIRQLVPPGPDPRLFSITADFNDRGEIILSTHVLSGGVLTRLRLPDDRSIQAVAINNHGQIAGRARLSSGMDRAVIWQQGAITLLSQRTAGQNTFAFDINNYGQVVGQTFCPIAVRDIAILWRDGGSYNLTRLISASDPLKPYVKLFTTRQINDRGQVLAIGFDTRDPLRADRTYLMTPVS